MFIADDGRTRSADFPRKVITGRFRVICGKNFALGCPVAGFYERPLWRLGKAKRPICGSPRLTDQAFGGAFGRFYRQHKGTTTRPMVVPRQGARLKNTGSF